MLRRSHGAAHRRARTAGPYLYLLLAAICVITTGCAETMQIGAVSWRRSDDFSRRDRRAIERRQRVDQRVDGDWQCDLDLGEGVTQAVADLIAVAIRRQQLINRSSHPDIIVRVQTRLDACWPYVFIARESPDSDVYEFGIAADGMGWNVRVRVVERQVELVEFSTWIA